MKKKLIIVDHNGGRLGNQLWNIANLYAYCLERGFIMRNYAFYQYARFFEMMCLSPFIDPMIRFLPQRLQRRLYTYLQGRIKNTQLSAVLRADEEVEGNPVRLYLPPSSPRSPNQESMLQAAENSSSSIYTFGWLFRNPVGLEKYRAQIVHYMRPRTGIRRKQEAYIQNLREKYKTIIGVHIRQGDYRIYRGGVLYFAPESVRQLLDAYLKATNKQAKETLFLVCSDEPIPSHIWEGLSVIQSKASPVEDLYLLSLTDRIIGSNSTFGGFAAWYGNIPITVFSHEKLDWGQEESKTTFVYEQAPSSLQL